MSAPTSPIIPSYFSNLPISGIQWTTPFVRRHPMFYPERSKLALAHEYCSKMELWKTFHQEVKTAGMEFETSRKKRSRKPRLNSGPVAQNAVLTTVTFDRLPEGQRAEMEYVPRSADDETIDEEAHLELLFSYVDNVIRDSKEINVTEDVPSKSDKKMKRYGVIYDSPPPFILHSIESQLSAPTDKRSRRHGVIFDTPPQF
ncbi:hypothetical protein E1B28_012689 [Marasmius oreades]|uniref:Uncharacterized protein n=1 Tax=Marasmius oreades TaxID=181124 RepID=A0A9P7RS00_9AGAR|nr:uncharacterized protein E1B28_012689 [Marasmius oreades]KAG7088721.1 hypothetical protein E1B28_012689 [Marasmius oreades]